MAKITFGKHRGSDIEDVPGSYLSWMLGKADGDGGTLDRFVRTHENAMRDAIATEGIRAAADFVVDYTLNDSQDAAVDAIETELLSGDSNLFRLEGGAGYGKSFCVMEVVRRALAAGYSVKACATSYVATQVLAAQLSRIGVQAKTIASQIRLAKIELEDTEQYILTGDTQDQLEHILGEGNLLIVDEYSMVGDEIADKMMACAQSYGGKLLVVGDLRQLPPVKQAADSSFAAIPGSVTLTEPMRYNVDSDLYTLEQLARFNPEGFARNDWGSSTTVRTHATMDELLDQYASDMLDDPREDLRMLFFRRADAYEANRSIRNRVFGAAADAPLVDNERLMVMSTTDISEGGFDQYGKPLKTRYYSGTTFLVNTVTDVEHRGVPCYLVKFDSGKVVHAIFGNGTTGDDTKRGTQEFRAKLNELREEAIETKSWRAFYDFKNEFLEVGYNYAMTVHRAQGQTVDRVYFDPARLRMGGGMASKLLYVAATRAKLAVHMVGS
jgi:uncharacterized protein (DUF3820 family)